MRSQDIVAGERYAWYVGHDHHNFEIGQVDVQYKGTLPGTVVVDVIHPEDQRPDQPDFRTVETKLLLGKWNEQPPTSKGYDHVLRHGITFAEHHDEVYARVQTQRELAGRLNALGIEYAKVAWLGRGGSEPYHPNSLWQIGLDPDQLAHLLHLAEIGKGPLA